MPYIALQLVGIQVVVGALGISGIGIVADLPLVIAFVILAAFTYSSGLRAPASIAIVKDILIYVTAFTAVFLIPVQLGGFAKIKSCFWPRPERIRPAPTAPMRRSPWVRRWRSSSIQLDDRDPQREQRSLHSPQCRAASGLFADARHPRPVRLFCHRRGCRQPS
jgi:hypothetical protein